MPQLKWDEIGTRVYENGIDKGVLYLPDGSGVSWSGLTEVVENFDHSVDPIYFDGAKVNDFVTVGNFSASLKAITYPNEFQDLQGRGSLRSGVYLGDQQLSTFCLCYRTGVGDDLGGVSGYKLHILYNLTAIPSSNTYSSLGDDPAIVEFEWTLTAVPTEIPGFRQTAHIIIDTAETDPWLMEELEAILYGTNLDSAALIPQDELIRMLIDWARIKIVDNGDGTWSAITEKGDFIFMDAPGEFRIISANAWFMDAVTYVLSDTKDNSQLTGMTITDHGDGTWTAHSEHHTLIQIDEGEESFVIVGGESAYLEPELYEIENLKEH